MGTEAGIPAYLGWMYSTVDIDDFRGVTLAKMALMVFVKDNARLGLVASSCVWQNIQQIFESGRCPEGRICWLL